MNARAVEVIDRVDSKLCGTDFVDSQNSPADVKAQVTRLINQATSKENLVVLYTGWSNYYCLLSLFFSSLLFFASFQLTDFRFISIP